MELIRELEKEIHVLWKLKSQYKGKKTNTNRKLIIKIGSFNNCLNNKTKQ